jgi:hypothetical protein
MSPRSGLGHLIFQCLAILLPGVAAADAEQKEQPPGAYAASQCVQTSHCPLFDEVYASTPAFRHALSLSLRHGGESVPEWVKDKLPNRRAERNTPARATASGMLPLRIDQRSYILGRISAADNPTHLLVALYDTQRGFATVYYVSQDGRAALLGDTTEILRKVVADYLNVDSAFAQSIARPDVALPIPVKSQ